MMYVFFQMLTLLQGKNIIRPMSVGIGIGGAPIDVFPLEPPITPSTTPPYDDYEEDYEENDDEESLKWDPALIY